MRQWFERTNAIVGQSVVRPIADMKRTLASTEALKGRFQGGDTYYLGVWTRSRSIAVTCSAVDWPNPACEAEVDAAKGEMRYLITFPPKIAEQVPKMIAIADRLFAPLIKECVQ